MVQEFRRAVRSLRAAPAFTVVALFVLTVGIGASTAIFSIVDAVVLRGLPFDEYDRLVQVALYNTQSNRYQGSTAPQDFLAWKAEQDVLSAFAAIASGTLTVASDAGPPEAFRGQRVTATFFDVFRVYPRLGRPFSEANEVTGAHRVVVISDGLWRRRFGADPGVIGQTLQSDDGSWEIVGVMPPEFSYPVSSSRPAEVLMPYVVAESEKQRGNSRAYYLQLVGRLEDGLTIDQADQRMALITAGLADQFPDWFTDQRGAVRSLHEALVGRVRSWMLMLLAAVGFVLLIACVNVANLMLARAAAREREIGIRAALGAGRWQIVRALLAESLVLSFAGTALATVVAWWGVDVLRAALPQTLPRISDIGIDLRILGAAAMTALGTGLVFGLAPALHLSKPNLTMALREGGRGSAGSAREWLRSMFVTAEVALAVVLLVGAGLFAASFVRLVNVDIGIDPTNVLTSNFGFNFDFRDPDSIEQASTRSAVVVPEILERVSALPGVVSAGVISGGMPLSGSYSRTIVQVPGVEERFAGDDAVDIRRITAGYPRAIGATLVKGRHIAETDTAESEPVVVLNEESVRRYLGETEPIGARITIAGDRTVVGVVKDVRLGGPESEIGPEAYVPVAQGRVVSGALVVRTAGDPLTIADGVSGAIAAAIPDVAVPGTATLESILARLMAQRQFNMLLVGLFGVVALVIAAVGIYGVMAFIVAQRTREIGVRMALGAQPGGVLRMVLARASVFLLLGLVAGLAGSWLLATTIESFLFQVAAHDPAVYAVAGVALVASGLLAALVPALRAARVDPLIALRVD